MKTRNRFLLGLLLIVLFIPGIILSQSDEEITLTVPVRLNNIHPNINSVTVRCSVSKPNDNDSWAEGEGSVEIPMPENGILEQDVIVVVTEVRPGQDINSANRYRCILRLNSELVSGSPNFCTGPTAHDDPPELCAKEGTELVTVVEGDIVR